MISEDEAKIMDLMVSHAFLGSTSVRAITDSLVKAYLTVPFNFTAPRNLRDPYIKLRFAYAHTDRSDEIYEYLNKAVKVRILLKELL